MLQPIIYQFQCFLFLLKKLLVISAFVGYSGFCVWAGVLFAESPIYKSLVAANNAKDGFVSEVQKFNPFKSNEQEKD